MNSSRKRIFKGFSLTRNDYRDDITKFNIITHIVCKIFQKQLKKSFSLEKLEQILEKNKVITGKTPLFVIDPLCSRHSISLDIGFGWK